MWGTSRFTTLNFNARLLNVIFRFCIKFKLLAKFGTMYNKILMKYIFCFLYPPNVLTELEKDQRNRPIY